jgi:hypothetical protein
MGAVVGGIGPVAVRYAAQIRELLFSQAMKRMAAEEEAARAEASAERAARLEALRSRIAPAPIEEPVKVEAETAKKAEHAEPVKTVEPIEPGAVPPAQIFNEQA